MVHSECLKERDQVISNESFKYFNELIDYVKEKGLRADFRKWKETKKVQKHEETGREN